MLVFGGERERGREKNRCRDTTREKRDENIVLVCVQPMSVSWEKGDNRERERESRQRKDTCCTYLFVAGSIFLEGNGGMLGLQPISRPPWRTCTPPPPPPPRPLQRRRIGVNMEQVQAALLGKELEATDLPEAAAAEAAEG